MCPVMISRTVAARVMKKPHWRPSDQKGWSMRSVPSPMPAKSARSASAMKSLLDRAKGHSAKKVVSDENGENDDGHHEQQGTGRDLGPGHAVGVALQTG